MPTNLPNPRLTPRFAGLMTFGRYPRLADSPAPDWSIFGVPFDSGVTYRPGARFGPRAIREASQYLKPYHLEHAIDVCQLLTLADAGDSPVLPYGLEENARTVTAFANALPKSSKLFALGGDHSIAYSNIRATFERNGSPKGGLAVIHFDSHLDTVDKVWDNAWGHASPFRRAIDDGLIDPKAMLSIGIKGPLNTGADLDYARDQGITIVTYERWARGDGKQAIQKFVDQLESRPAYITFDIDAIDPAFAPGTGTLSVGGFTSAEALHLLRSLKHSRTGKPVKVIGGDVVEVLPDRDPSGITAMLAAHIAFEILALDALGRV